MPYIMTQEPQHPSKTGWIKTLLWLSLWKQHDIDLKRCLRAHVLKTLTNILKAVRHHMHGLV